MRGELLDIFGGQPFDLQFRGDALEAGELGASFVLVVAVGLLAETVSTFHQPRIQPGTLAQARQQCQQIDILRADRPLDGQDRPSPSQTPRHSG